MIRWNGYGIKRVRSIDVYKRQHRDNRPMQKALHKFGFRQCGIVYMEDGTERVAFDFLRETERSH